jgi:hypothetical protein
MPLSLRDQVDGRSCEQRPVRHHRRSWRPWTGAVRGRRDGALNTADAASGLQQMTLASSGVVGFGTVKTQGCPADAVTDRAQRSPRCDHGVILPALPVWGPGVKALNALDQAGCRLRVESMGRLSTVRGRPALPGCSTNAMSSATTSLIGCPPMDGSAVASMFEGRPARVLAGTPVEGADHESLM